MWKGEMVDMGVLSKLGLQCISYYLFLRKAK